MSENKLSDILSVDCVVFGFNFEQLNVLLVDRKLMQQDEMVFSDLTLMGNHIYEDEELNKAANRVLEELTGLNDVYLEQFKTFGHPDRLKQPKDQQWLKACGRNPDTRIFTVAYFALLNSDQTNLTWKGRNVKWYPVDEVKGLELGFDHKIILDEALVALRKKLRDEPIGFELLPDKFTLSQLQKVYELILGTELDKRNFRKKIARMKYLIPLDEKQIGVAHKPARLYLFSREVYEKTKKEFLDFIV